MKRSEKSETTSFASHATAELAIAPSREHRKNNFTGEKRSASEKKEKIRVPAIKPSITADVTRLTAYWLR